MNLLSFILLLPLCLAGRSALACEQKDLGNGQYLRQSQTGGLGAWKFARCYCDADDQLVAGGCDVTPSRSSNTILGAFTSSIPVVNGNAMGWLCQLHYADPNGGRDEILLTRVICKS